MTAIKVGFVGGTVLAHPCDRLLQPDAGAVWRPDLGKHVGIAIVLCATSGPVFRGQARYGIISAVLVTIER